MTFQEQAREIMTKWQKTAQEESTEREFVLFEREAKKDIAALTKAHYEALETVLEGFRKYRVSIKPGRGEPAHDVIHWSEVANALAEVRLMKEDSR